MLRVENLTKCYDAEKALDGVSLTLEAGRILGLIGENGAGKSTFTKCLTGVVKPTSGRIELEPGVSVGWIPQEVNLVEHLTVTENIFLGRERSRFGLLDRAAMRREAARRLARLHADIDPDTPVAELPPSGKQMVEFAKALDESYRLLLMDEPMIGLDPHAIKELKKVMEEMRAEGRTVLLSTHMIDSVDMLWDRTLIMQGGELRADVTKAQLDANGERLEELFFAITEGAAAPDGE